LRPQNHYLIQYLTMMHQKSNYFLEKFSIFCFSHLRWGFVYQRPQHLLSRFAKYTDVYFFEEPVFGGDINTLHVTQTDADKVTVVVPYLQHGLNSDRVNAVLEELINSFITRHDMQNYCSWYYTPMALNFTRHLYPGFIVYDCMDELSSFKFAPPALQQLEAEMFEKADIVFTGGYSIYEAKKHSHSNIYPFPSSIDKEHFGKARTIQYEMPEQEHIPHPRLGFFGVIDERFDIDLIYQVAQQKPQWHFVIIGPIVKIDAATLPNSNNIHYLGSKDYKDLPGYLAGWDIAMIPFAINESTRFISPTKTPEYLAGGKPVISTAIADVADPYGENGFVDIIGNVDEFIKAAELSLLTLDKHTWLHKVDDFIKDHSWNNTWQQMLQLITETMIDKNINKQQKKQVYV